MDPQPTRVPKRPAITKPEEEHLDEVEIAVGLPPPIPLSYCSALRDLQLEAIKLLDEHYPWWRLRPLEVTFTMIYDVAVRMTPKGLSDPPFYQKPLFGIMQKMFKAVNRKNISASNEKKRRRHKKRVTLNVFQ